MFCYVSNFWYFAFAAIPKALPKFRYITILISNGIWKYSLHSFFSLYIFHCVFRTEFNGKCNSKKKKKNIAMLLMYLSIVFYMSIRLTLPMLMYENRSWTVHQNRDLYIWAMCLVGVMKMHLLPLKACSESMPRLISHLCQSPFKWSTCPIFVISSLKCKPFRTLYTKHANRSAR